MNSAKECLASAKDAGDDYQRAINGFVDAFRRAPRETKMSMVSDAFSSAGELEGLIAAVVSALCREAGISTPAWAATIGSPRPFFPYPSKSFEMRLRLMLESPPPFASRNVFVPSNYLSRA
jgi:hypothetical protein